MRKFFTVEDDFNTIITKSLDCPVSEIKKIVNGWTNFVFKVKDSKNQEYIFRFPRNDFFSDALVKEVKYNAFVKDKISFKITNLCLGYFLDRPYSFHKAIEGKNLYEMLEFMNEENKLKLCNDICKFIFELQNIDYSECTDIEKLSTFLDNLADISSLPGMYDHSIHDELAKKEITDKLVLNHGDLNPGNILINNNFEIEAILDFAFCTVSCDIEDLSRLIGRLPEEFCEMLIKSYESVFGKNVDRVSLGKLITMWNYVDNNYINYMKTNCPDVVIPS